MSALEPGLMVQLVAEPTPEQKALQRVATICRNAEFIASRETRIFRIVLEGLGVPPQERDIAVQTVIQAKRDRIAERRAAEGGEHANP